MRLIGKYCKDYFITGLMYIPFGLLYSLVSFKYGNNKYVFALVVLLGFVIVETIIKRYNLFNDEPKVLNNEGKWCKPNDSFMDSVNNIGKNLNKDKDV